MVELAPVAVSGSCARWSRGWRQVPLPCAVGGYGRRASGRTCWPMPAAPGAEAASRAAASGSRATMTAGGDGPAKCPFHEPPGAPAPAQEASAPASAEKVASFDELAAASKAQVEHVAAGLGVEVAHPGTPIQAEAVEAPGERRLESRSSGGVEPVLESVEPTVVAAETAPEPRGQEAAPDLGSPAAQGEAPAVEEAVIVVEEAVIVEVAAATPAVAESPRRRTPRPIWWNRQPKPKFSPSKKRSSSRWPPSRCRARACGRRA